MNGKNFNIPANKTRILVAPLDWGLGHATRCIPLIHCLIQQNCDVIVAASGATKILLKKEFPNLVFLHLAGYNMQYSRHKAWLPLKLLSQLPKLLYRVYAERSWLKKMVRLHKLDAVISDNRLGLSNPKIPTVYITHQLNIKTGNSLTEKWVQKIHYHYINKYSFCWIPDAAGNVNLAGDLSHPQNMPQIPTRFLGPLTRFKKYDTGINYQVCVLLSGPEPQRTILENQVFKELPNWEGVDIICVRGLPAAAASIPSTHATIKIVNHLPAKELNEVLLQSKLIICRSGYSSIMDLAGLQKTAVLVPTPAQTEQEYLARYLQEQKLFLTIDQAEFSFAKAVEKAKTFILQKTPSFTCELDAVVESFLHSLPGRNQ